MRFTDPRDLLEFTTVKDIQEIGRLAARLSRRAGFLACVYGFSKPGGWRKTGWTTLINGYSETWKRQYAREQYASIDPVSHYCFATRWSRPLVWHPAVYDSPLRRAFAEDALAHGIGIGISCPLVMPNGQRGALSVSVDQAGADARAFAEHNQAWALLLAAHVHDAFDRLLVDDPSPNASADQEPPRLTPKELACLQLCARGRSICDTADELNVSSSRVKQLRRSLCRKFNLASMRQVIVRATALGVFHP